MSKEYLAPNQGSGRKPSVSRGTGPNHHGRAINPPDFSKFGGFVSPNPTDADMGSPSSMDIKKPGFEK